MCLVVDFPEPPGENEFSLGIPRGEPLGSLGLSERLVSPSFKILSMAASSASVSHENTPATCSAKCVPGENQLALVTLA